MSMVNGSPFKNESYILVADFTDIEYDIESKENSFINIRAVVVHH